MGAQGLRQTRVRLIERERELVTLAAALEAAADGDGAALIVDGPLGIGKSALLEAARALAHELEFEVFSATGDELEREFPFGVALQLFEERVAGLEDEGQESPLSARARGAAQLFFGQLPDDQAEADLFSIVHGLFWLCAELADERPLVICVDDLHWCDEPTLRFLVYLARRIQSLPVVLVGAVSGGTSGHRELLRQLCAKPLVQPLNPAPLTVEAVHTRAAIDLDGRPDGAFPAACHEATAGNPWLLSELLDELRERGTPPDDRAVASVLDAVPRRVAQQALTAARRAEHGAELLQAAAVLGEDADLDHVARFAGTDPQQAAGTVRDLAELGILEHQARPVFVAPIVRRAIRASLDPAERAEAHLRAAHLLHEAGADAHAIAEHLLLARPERLHWEVAALQAAAAQATAERRPLDASRYLRRALEACPRPEEQAHLLRDLGRAEAAGSEPEAADHLCHAVEVFSDPLERARGTLEAARILSFQGRSREAAETLLRGLAEPCDDELLAMQLRVAHAFVTRMGQTSRKPPDLARIGEPPAQAETPAERLHLTCAAYERALAGEAHDSVCDLARRGLAGGELLADETADGFGPYLAAFALMIAEQLEEARGILDLALEDARARASALGEAGARHLRGEVLLRAGLLDEAHDDAHYVLSAAHPSWQFLVARSRITLVGVLLERGLPADAAAQVGLAPHNGRGADMPNREARGVSPPMSLGVARGTVQLELGHPKEALEDFLFAGRLMEAVGAPNPAVQPWRSGAARAAAAIGDLAEARRLLDTELRLARDFGSPAAIARAVRGMASLEEGAAQIDGLQEALTLLEQSEATLERAHTHVELGIALRRAKRRAAATEALRLGLDLAARCGASALVDLARSQLAAAGARPRRAFLSGPASLTARELQVAQLAAAGRSNREIAQTLFVTVKTVEWHLGRAFQKLGLESRRELAAVLNEGGAPPH